MNNTTTDIDVINKRNSQRKSVNLPVVFSDQKNILQGKTVNISASGLSISSDVLFQNGTDIDVWMSVNNDYFFFRTQVVRHSENSNGNYTISLKFTDPDNNDLFKLKSLLNLHLKNNQEDYNNFPYTLDLRPGNHRVISDSNLIAILLTRMYEEGLPVYIKQNLSNMLHTFALTSIDPVSVYSSFRVRNLNVIENFNYSNYQELVLYLDFQSSFYVLKTKIIAIEDENICLKIPDSMLQLWRRSHPKSRLDLNNERVDARFITHCDKEYTFNINNIGYRGLSLSIPSRDILPEIGALPVKIGLNIQDELDISFAACLKYIDEKLTDTGNIYNCGFEITSIDPENREKLGSFIFKRNYPHIVSFNEKYIDKIWDLFFKSGYMIAEKREYVSKVKKEIEETWSRLYGGNSKIGEMLLFMDNNEIYGTIAAAQAYENTWVIHQVAGLRHPSVRIGKYILDSIAILMIEHLDMEYAKAEFRKENEWAIKKFFKFHEYCTLEDAIQYSFLDLYEIDIDKYKYFKAGNIDIEIDYLSLAEDRLFITDYLTKTLPKLTINAESINNFGLELPETQLAYRNIDLFRGRKILIAKENKRIISFALLEHGSTGINLGGLLDVFQIFTVDLSNENLNTINRILINEIIDFYNSIGKKTALCFCIANDINKYVLEAAGLTKMLDYITWYFNNNAFKQITQYFYNSYAPLNKGTDIRK